MFGLQIPLTSEKIALQLVVPGSSNYACLLAGSMDEKEELLHHWRIQLNVDLMDVLKRHTTPHLVLETEGAQVCICLYGPCLKHKQKQD